MRTLNNLSDLRESMFGRPPPRHGLNLLWWFAHESVRIDSNGRIIALYNPAHRDFGFCLFHNKEGLLPFSYLPYYEVGNLKKTDPLPGYVTEKYTGWSDESNTDRIIVSFDSRWNRFDSIYVTRHSGALNFDQNHIYRISIDLLKEIKSLNRAEFLRQTMYNLNPYQMHFHQQSNRHSQFTASHQSLQGQRSHQTPWDSQFTALHQSLQGQRSHQTSWDDTCCALLFAFLLFVLVICACLFVIFKKKIV